MSPPRRKVFRRTFLRLAVGAATLPAASHIARAQSYPARPIRLVVPFPPGGAYDLVGRPLADKFKPLLGTMVIENIGGGGPPPAAPPAPTTRRGRPPPLLSPRPPTPPATPPSP